MEQFLSLCDTFGQTNEAMVAKWEAFCMNHNVESPTAGHVTQFVSSVRQTMTTMTSPDKKVVGASPRDNKKRPAESNTVIRKENIAL